MDVCKRSGVFPVHIRRYPLRSRQKPCLYKSLKASTNCNRGVEGVLLRPPQFSRGMYSMVCIKLPHRGYFLSVLTRVTNRDTYPKHQAKTPFVTHEQGLDAKASCFARCLFIFFLSCWLNSTMPISPDLNERPERARSHGGGPDLQTRSLFPGGFGIVLCRVPWRLEMAVPERIYIRVKSTCARVDAEMRRCRSCCRRSNTKRLSEVDMQADRLCAVPLLIV